MREIDSETWLMLAITWIHGLLCGYAIWGSGKGSASKDDE